MKHKDQTMITGTGMMSAVIRSAWLVILLLPSLSREAQGVQAASDSVVYRLAPASRLVVKTGKGGLLGFAGHTHVIRARAVSGELVNHPGTFGSYLRLELATEKLEVLTPQDTVEIRKVTEAMRTEVLHVDRYPEMAFRADSLAAKSGRMAFDLVVTMHGATRRIPVTAEVTIGPDSVRARGVFTAKQTDFGIKPYSGGPGGTVKVADKVTFCFDLLGVRDLPAGAAEEPVSAAIAVPGCEDR